MTVYLMISLPKIPYIHRIFMVQANPKNLALPSTSQRLLSQFEVASVGPSFAGTTSAVACVVRAREKRRPHGTWAHKSLLRASPKQGRPHGTWIGLARAIYIRCMYGIFGRKITKYTAIYGVYIQFWQTLIIVGQNRIDTVYIRYSWQGNHQIYGHIRRIYTVLANPKCSRPEP